MKKSYLFFVSFFILSCTNLNAQDFFGYYTRTDYEDGISGKYADIIVSYDKKGKVIFSRESSYLPKWETDNGQYYFDEIIERMGDGTELQSDRFNRHSYVRIIENTPETVLIHWRYYPDILKTEMTDVVHELFTFTPDGNVRREIKKGTEKIEDWEDPSNVFVQMMKLTGKGINEVALKKAEIMNKKQAPVEASPVKSYESENPAAYWSFDKGMNNMVKESVSNIKMPVGGHKSYWVKGVSGTALKFDGYFSAIKFPTQYTPKIAGEFTIAAWIAMAAHPFGWVPVIQQSQWKNNGYYFGINASGQIGFHANIDREWKSFVTDKMIDINRWTHIAVTFGDESKEVVLYVDGEPQSATGIEADDDPVLIHANAPLTIGLNNDPLIPLPRERFTYGQYPCITGFEGAIDEVVIYNSELNEKQIQDSYQRFKPDETLLTNPGFEKRILPGRPGYADKFGAVYTKFKYHDLWDNAWRTSEYPDILVKFDELPTSVTFWRGPSYGAGWVTENNYWMIDQSVESGNAVSYGEHMSDKQGRYSHVRLIENTDARVVIHWRYSASDVLYSFFKHYGDAGVWIDEYMTIYPDGVGIRKVKQKALSGTVKSKPIDWEERTVDKISWQDVQFAAQPGMTPDDVMNLEAVHLANLKGETATMDWTDGVPPENPLPSANIELINFKSEYKVFLAFQDGIFINPWGQVPEDMYCHFMTWNHWPVAFITSQGKSSLYPSRVTHSALCAADNAVDHGNMAMYGFTNKSVETLIPLAKSWCNPPQIANIKGAEDKGYVKEERAYHLTASSDFIAFDLKASEDKPIVNLCFIIKNYSKKNNAEIFINDKRIKAGSDFRQGSVFDTDGKAMKIIWLKHRSDSPINIQIE
jgi:hypothetical protein